MSAHPELTRVKHLIVVHRKSIVGYFSVTGVKVVDRQCLKEHDYPVKSSKHRSDTLYLLFSLKKKNEAMVNIKWDDFTVILGKGISFK